MSSSSDDEYPISRRDLTIGLGTVATATGAHILWDVGKAFDGVLKNLGDKGSNSDPQVTIRRPDNGEEFEEGTDVGYIVDVLTAQEPGQLTISSGEYERNEDVGAQTDREFRGEISDLEPGDHTLEALLEHDGQSVGETVNFEASPSNDGGSNGNAGEDPEPNYPFGDIESTYLEEYGDLRADFEDYLDGVKDEGLLDTLEVIETAPGYMIQTNDSHVDLEARLLAGNENKSNEFGFSDDFSEELYQLSDDEPGEFTDFLEYIEEGEIYN